jgi:hypothetical protein
MMLKIGSKYNEENRTEQYIDSKAVVAFTVFPDRTITLHVAGATHPIKVGPFTERALNVIVDDLKQNEEKYPLDVYDDMFNIEHVLTDDFILSYWTQSHTVDEWNKILKDYYKL